MTSFTKKAIFEAFVRLLDHTPLSKITVKDIARECGISRNTFYYHFSDIYSMLEELFSDELQKNLLTDNGPLSFEEHCLRTIDFLSQNRKAMHNIYHSINREQLERYLFISAGRVMEELVQKLAGKREFRKEDLQRITEYHTFTWVGFLLQWFDQGMSLSMEKDISRICGIMEEDIRRHLQEAEENTAH